MNYGLFKIKYSIILNTPLTSLPLKRTFDTTFKYLAYSVDKKRENLKIILKWKMNEETAFLLLDRHNITLWTCVHELFIPATVIASGYLLTGK